MLRTFLQLLSLLQFTFVLQLCASVYALDIEKPLVGKKAVEKVRSYALGDKILVECLNRTVDTGEHIMDAKGELQYIPFPICNETNRPLELSFGSEKDINCTIPTLPDPLFHLLEFYIHSDAPLSCRVATRPISPSSALLAPDYTHLQFALTGILQLSHLHINPALNVILHTVTSSTSTTLSNKKANKESEGAILAATAYSIPSPPNAPLPRLVIGDPLPLSLSVRWYSSRTLPPSTSKLSGLGGHVHFSTLLYCILSFGAGGAVSLVWWRGWEMPRRMKRYGSERIGGGMGERGYAWPGSGVLNGGMIGKRD